MDKDNNEKMIREFSHLIKQHYFCPEIGHTTQRLLLKNIERNVYSSIPYNQELASKVSDDIFSVTRDKHFTLSYDPDFIAQKNQAELNKSTAKHWGDDVNYGFKEIKILKGNIGFIKLTGFYDTEFASTLAASAMHLVERTNALIFDIRENGGGYLNMVQLICSYLFGTEPVLLDEFHSNKKTVKNQCWTLPHVQGKKRSGIPVFILTSHHTFSAAENFAYNLQSLNRATVIGEPTKGAATGVKTTVINELFWSNIPDSISVNPTTGQNWHCVGVRPNIRSSAEAAFDIAYDMAIK
ncbi:S41 family peptidase [Veronia pacifica]|uniref:Tail specific protease domain-containing protein n=1 Tax=Veronia pacifica TaxID=1080227 RepID=A0A1C3EBF1_9GAMM|nr:S41 family peptidase [Veronia pacifica]ODA30587.1 hypothetical protein A8L45_19840 [Veronia pacifica]